MAAQKKVITRAVEAKHYQVVVDSILAGTNGPEEARPDQLKPLKGVVSGADLVAAGCDIEWLLRVGSIEELGYAQT
jgi:hypothetical protein